MASSLEHTNRDRWTFLHNAELSTVNYIEPHREKVARHWKKAFHAQVREWEREELLTIPELIYILTSVAFELQGEVMKK